MAKEEPDSPRELVSEHYRGQDIDFDTAVDRFDIMEGGANPNPPPLDDDTEANIIKRDAPENPNDPYCTC